MNFRAQFIARKNKSRNPFASELQKQGPSFPMLHCRHNSQGQMNSSTPTKGLGPQQTHHRLHHQEQTLLRTLFLRLIPTRQEHGPTVDSVDS